MKVELSVSSVLYLVAYMVSKCVLSNRNNQ